jgi:hypothetical protein
MPRSLLGGAFGASVVALPILVFGGCGSGNEAVSPECEAFVLANPAEEQFRQAGRLVALDGADAASRFLDEYDQEFKAVCGEYLDSDSSGGE